MSHVDDACRRVLRMKYRLDLFKNPTQKLKNYPKFGGEEFAKLALEDYRKYGAPEERG